MTADDSVEALRSDLASAWHRFVDTLAPLRPGLHGYCRRLTGNLWDAEDLVQDTLLRAFGKWGVSEGAVRNPRAYLLRTATNVWIDGVRRREVGARALAVVGLDTAGACAAQTTGVEARAAGSRLLQRLSPQERAAVVLREVFDMSLEEIATTLATTTGAVKAALHRGRERLREAEHETEALPERPLPSVQVVDRFVELCNAQDLDGLLSLMLDGAVAENVGNSMHVGVTTADGVPRFLRSLVHGHPEWPAAFQPESRRLERIELGGETIVLGFWARGGKEVLTSVFRFDEVDDRIARIRSYAFCPETIRAIGEILGLRVLTGLYRAPTPAPGERWPEPARH